MDMCSNKPVMNKVPCLLSRECNPRNIPLETCHIIIIIIIIIIIMVFIIIEFIY
jgi:hypothetical protein